MPAVSTLVPHYQQCNPGSCLPACARMVLAALGDERSEAQLAATMGSYEFGTPASWVKRLNRLGYQVEYDTFSLAQLQTALDRGLYPIVFVRADVLPWADFGGFHAVVLVGILPGAVMLHDPALDCGPTRPINGILFIGLGRI